MIRSAVSLFVMLCLAIGIVACDQAPTPIASPVTFFDKDFPDDLSAWQLLEQKDGILRGVDGVIPYDLNTPLFSDYAHKYRTVWTPSGAKAKSVGETDIEWPVGTVFTKTFYYPTGGDGHRYLRKTATSPLEIKEGGLDLNKVRLIETRLLVHTSEGWVALPYIWDEETQSKARLEIAGDLLDLTLVDEGGGTQDISYLVPDTNDCSGCHAANKTGDQIKPIGPRIDNLNRTSLFFPDIHQLALLEPYLGEVEPEFAPKMAVWQDRQSGTVAARARAYLDVNCAHCHTENRPADTSGLFLGVDENNPLRVGLCKPPVAAGRGSGGHDFSIVPGDPEQSILAFRMAATDPAIAMPELGRSTIHAEGLKLIREWISEMDGACSAPN